MISIAPTILVPRRYRTAQVAWRRRVCESRTAPHATPRHENHARSCVSVFLCGSDSRFRFLLFAWRHILLLHSEQKRTFCGHKHFKIEIKIICGSGCVSAAKPARRILAPIKIAAPSFKLGPITFVTSAAGYVRVARRVAVGWAMIFLQ